jgi:peptidoglycan/LPS O-acetylase OafA/YrhL
VNLSINSPKKQLNNYIPQLDGLRGIAILMVVSFHYFPNTYLFRFGWSGVDLFFVLSGYLITGRLLPFLNDRRLLQKFYWNRFVRIVPLYFGFLILFFAGWFLFASNKTVEAFPFYHKHWWQFFLFFQNWVYIYNSGIPIDNLNHLWSLAAEEQFYIFFPLLIISLNKVRHIFFTLITLIFIILTFRCIYYYHITAPDNFTTIYWNTFFRADSFLTGGVFYIVFNYYSPSIIRLRIYKLAFILATLCLLFFMYLYRDLSMANPFIETCGFTLLAFLFSYILYIVLNKKNEF